MSVEKDSLTSQEDEEVLSGEDECDHDNFPCKYCEFHTENIDELDEHIITHEEALVGDNDEEEEADSIDEDAPTTSTNEKEAVNNEQVIPPQFSLATDVSQAGKKMKQQLPAFYGEFANKANKKVFVCPYCGYQSMKKLDMNRHIREHNQPVEVPVYACAECPYTTRRKCDMPKHLLTHCENGTVTMYKCTECSYATKRKGDLSKHMLCHTKPSMSVFSCSECLYTSKRHGDLRKHLACHANEASGVKSTFIFNCTECGYTSKRLNDLHKHAVLHCDRTVKGVFKCTKCDYASATSSPFAKHVLSHCKVRDMAVTVFPKDSSMQEYIVLEEEEVHLYQLDKDNVAAKEVPVVKGEMDRKRKTSKEDQSLNFKKINLKSYYVDVAEGGEVDGTSGQIADKVVVLPGYSEDERNMES